MNNATATATTMRAIVQDAYGTSEVLQVAQVDRPRLADDEVLVQVRAAGLDRGTWHLMTGQPYLMRILGFGFRAPKNRVPGLDVAGTVAEVGSAVSGCAVGDEVFGISRGSFADFAAAREDKLSHRSRPGRHCKPSPMPARCVRASGCSSPVPLAESARTRCSWRKRSAPR
jgi:NADPH:quinone reductase-like Zn-dependent oxidoreductase